MSVEDIFGIITVITVVGMCYLIWRIEKDINKNK